HLDEALTSMGLPTDGGVWLIRRLDLSAAIGRTWSSQRIAKAMARSVAVEVMHTISAGPDGTNVIWFPDRASFVARYLVDAAAGRHRRAGGRSGGGPAGGGGVDARRVRPCGATRRTRDDGHCRRRGQGGAGRDGARTSARRAGGAHRGSHRRGGVVSHRSGNA